MEEAWVALQVVPFPAGVLRDAASVYLGLPESRQVPLSMCPGPQLYVRKGERRGRTQAHHIPCRLLPRSSPAWKALGGLRDPAMLEHMAGQHGMARGLGSEFLCS